MYFPRFMIVYKSVTKAVQFSYYAYRSCIEEMNAWTALVIEVCHEGEWLINIVYTC